jgi:hypothetical protein
MKPSPLSLEFKIACEIYRCNKKKKLATFKEISNVFMLFGYSNKKIVETIDTLFSWGMLKCEHHEPTKSRLYFIDIQSLPIIKDFYKSWWKKERKELFKS